ncbi:hypothetical protein [Ammoniphilus sp. CFH 90114]|uniref:hypothetical protein n=1 Tax=Ammoniphilus sp. CFH 90114 TaxID=2493665 RepID=UPI00100F7D48|nr:hypothetical protein [Ammoniphilus sp. CFH 90114]RXT04169.1 hypothetical protein EIZ39_21575 [Ammoniphilus sp. CFH 90114]
MVLPRSELEKKEFEAIQEWFPHSRIKEDYNREILDIGVEISIHNQVFILLKGEQTGHTYEVIDPECKWYEGLVDLNAVDVLIKRICRESS